MVPYTFTGTNHNSTPQVTMKLEASMSLDEDIDFRLWFHDLFRPSHRPYNPKETELIRRICDLAEQGKV